MEENQNKTSKFSSGLNIIMRLDELWKETHKDSKNGKFKDWNTDLDRIWLELARDFDDENEEEFTEYKKKFDKFDEDIKKIGKIQDKLPDGFENLTEEDIGKRDKHYETLMKKQLFLARLENHLGKGTTYDDGDDDDFD